MDLTLWTIRVAAALYVVAMAAWLTGREEFSRGAWTAACGFYLAHVAAAFQLHHHWSHSAAYEETARQTFEVFGMRWGGGLYFNYVFTVIWLADALLWWLGRRRLAIAINWFFAFMFFNATVVFATGPTRWLGLASTVGLAVLWWRMRV